MSLFASDWSCITGICRTLFECPADARLLYMHFPEMQSCQHMQITGVAEAIQKVTCYWHVQVAGVDEDAEQEALLRRAQPSANRGPAPPGPRIINPHPLQAKVCIASLH